MPNSNQDQVVTLSGDLGLIDLERISALLPNPAQVRGRVIIDCSDVRSMESAILALIMTYRQRLLLAGLDARETLVAVAPPRLIRLFELTGISRVITVVATKDDADTQNV